MTKDKCIWVTVEDPTQASLVDVKETLRESDLSNRYEIIVTDDTIDTMDMEELEEKLNDD